MTPRSSNPMEPITKDLLMREIARTLGVCKNYEAVLESISKIEKPQEYYKTSIRQIENISRLQAYFYIYLDNLKNPEYSNVFLDAHLKELSESKEKLKAEMLEALVNNKSKGNN